MRAFVHALVGTVAICLGWPLSVSGQSIGTRDGGVDLVVLIDQSGSMWGNPRTHPGKNDPWGHRIGAAKSIILRLIQHTETTRAVHRVAVVDFADEAVVALPIQEIRIDSANPTALDRLRSLLEASVQARDWGNTNTATALQAALKLFGQMDATSPSPNRRRLVLLVTDGRPTTPTLSEPALRQSIRDHVKALSDRRVELWVVGLNDADDYWNAGEGAFWEELAGKGRARFAESAAVTLPSVFQGIVDEWLGIRSVLVAGSEYDCPPYLRRIVFHATFGRPRGEIKILDPDGRELKRTGGGPSSLPGTFEQFAVDDPKSGTYRLIRDSSRSALVQVEEYSPFLERLQPTTTADRGVRTPLILVARMASGETLTPVSSSPIKATFFIRDQFGAETELPATASADGRFEGTWEPAVAGRHSVTLRGLIRRKDGTDYDIFANVGDTYSPFVEVGTRLPYRLRLALPEIQQGVRILPWQRSVVVRFELIGPDGKEVATLDNVVREARTWLTLQSQHARAAVGTPVELNVESPARFFGTIPLAVDWLSGEAWLNPGELGVRVLPQPGRMIGDQYLHSLLLPPGYESYRLEDDPLSAGPIMVRASGWVWALLVLTCLSTVTPLFWLVLGRLIPLWVIRREDRDAHRQVVLKVHDDVHDPAADGGRDFNLTGGCRFKFDGQVTIDLDNQTFVAERFRFVRRPRAGGRASGVLVYRWRGEKKERETPLISGSYSRLAGLPNANFVARLTES